jgi:hypothetical protein
MNNYEHIRAVTLKVKLVEEINELISNLEDAVADREKGITSWVRSTEEIDQCRHKLRAAIYDLIPMSPADRGSEK